MKKNVIALAAIQYGEYLNIHKLSAPLNLSK